MSGPATSSRPGAPSAVAGAPPRAQWVVQENSLPGTTDWVITGNQAPRSIEGFASKVSAVSGDDVELFVNTSARSFHVEAYRMGYYQALGGRLVHRSDEVSGTVQSPPVLTPGTNVVECHWQPSLSLKIDSGWPPGAYLLKLVGSGGEQQFVPLCIRDDSSDAAFVVQHSVTTWQAYNLWGGHSLYYGTKDGSFTFGQKTAGKDFDHRSRIVSFDRPYSHDWAQGASDFVGNEFPLSYHMERLGLDLTYRTDVDLHAAPARLLQNRCLLSLGHDEYWSLEMRDGALQARDAGVNLAFLGANACYRQIRLQDSSVGPYRQEVCYKSATEDPMSGVDPMRATAPSWVSAPTRWAESELVGIMYQDIGANADMVVVDASSWIWSGTGLKDGQHLPGVLQGEYDAFDTRFEGPRNVEVIAHSPVANRGPGKFSDVSWYTVPGGGGVFASGNASWISFLSDTTGFPTGIVPAAVPGVTEVLLAAMENLYSVLGSGPASSSRPSRGNWEQVAPPSSAPISESTGQ